MDKEFQDKIDEYLLHESEMKQSVKDEFVRELNENSSKKGQYEFTLNVKEAICSRKSKGEVITLFHKKYLADRKRERHRKLFRRIMIGGSSIAAIFVVGFFFFRPIIHNDEPKSTIPEFSPEKKIYPEISFGSDSDGILDSLSDSIALDSISGDSKLQDFIDDGGYWDKLRE